MNSAIFATATNGAGQVELTFDPIWPIWISIVIGLLGIGLIVWSANRETASRPRTRRLNLLSIRIVLLLLLLALAARPTWNHFSNYRPTVRLIIDDSASMQIQNRFAQVRSFIKSDRFKSWSDQYQVDSVFLDQPERLERSDLPKTIESVEPKCARSRLASAILAATEPDPDSGLAPGAIVLLTDAVATDPDQIDMAIAHAKLKKIPIHALVPNRSGPAIDLKLTGLHNSPVGVVGKPIKFEAQLTATADARAGAKFSLRVRLTESTDPNRVLAETQIDKFDADRPTLIRLEFSPTKPGLATYTIGVDKLAGETIGENNRFTRTIEIREKPIKILLAFDRPSYEFRALDELLSGQTVVELSTFLATADAGNIKQKPLRLSLLPSSVESWASYDLIILGDLSKEHLNDSAIKRLIESRANPGKGLVIIATENAKSGNYFETPLAAILPVEPDRSTKPDRQTSGFFALPTQIGIASSILKLGPTAKETSAIWSQMPELYWRLDTVRAKRSARVLATAFGPNRFATDMVGSQSANDRPPVILLQQTDGGRVLMQLTDESWRWRHSPAGNQFARYWLGAISYLPRSPETDRPTGRSTVAEFGQMEVDLYLLEKIAKQTGGSVTAIDKSDQIDRFLPSPELVRGRRGSTVRLASHPAAIGLFLLLLSLEWLVRRRLRLA
jgi:hypothetical protein